MECYDSLIVDLDGVLWRGARPIQENAEALARLARSGVPIIFLTNNSTRSRRMYASIISRMLEAPISRRQVVNSGYSAAVWLRERAGCANTLIVGEEGLVEELVGMCHRPVRPEDWREADAVVVGLHRDVTYKRLASAHKAILAGALFVATNTDRSFPVEDGTEPGAGALVRFLVESTGREPDADTGKPGKWILELALRGLPQGSRPLIIGDRVDTDMEMARRAGLPGLLVLTGVTRTPPEEPWFRIAPNLSVLRPEDGRACLSPGS